MRALALIAMAATLGACMEFKYAAIGSEKNPTYGYRDTHNADGGYTILVVMPQWSTNISLAQQYWDRRAQELCGHANYRKNIFRAQRSNVYYDYDGARPGDYYLEGYLYCDGATPAAPTQP